MHVIDNCIQWNLERLKQAKTPAEERRYQENIKNLEALRATEGAE